MVNWEERLGRLDFSPNEAKVYLALLELGPSSCGPICQKTGLYRVMAYNVLENLLAKGLISYFTKNNRRTFHVESPEKILDAIKEQEFEAGLLVADLKKIRPSEKKDEGVRLYEGLYGVRAAQENYFEIMEKGRGEYLMFGASLQLHEKLDTFFNYFHQRRSSLKIRARLLFNENNRAYGNLKKKFGPVEVRYMPENVITPSWTSVYGDTVLIGIFGDKPLALSVNNQKLAESFRNYFELMWRLGKP